VSKRSPVHQVNFNYPMAVQATREALRLGLRDRAEQFQTWLREGQLTKVIETLDRVPAALADLLPVIADPAANMNLRLGASAAFERQAGTAALKALVPALGLLAAHTDPRVRADASYLLGLSGTPDAEKYLIARRDDPDAEVREIVADSLHALNPDR
jgi:HEAT repeat protein